MISHLGQSNGASRVHLHNEGRHLRHTEPGLDEKSPAAREGGPALCKTVSDMLTHGSKLLKLLVNFVLRLSLKKV